MKYVLILFLIGGQSLAGQYVYDATPENPYGLPNPEAPVQIKEYHDLIGSSTCKSIQRNPDGTWKDTTTMIWRFKYIMNGMGVQDETLKEDGIHSGSLRQYNPDTGTWYVHYYSSNAAAQSLPAWEGGKVEADKMVLYRPLKAPNGMDGKYKITFANMTDKSFDWYGAWVTPDESVVYPTWNIHCIKETSAPMSEESAIRKNIKTFSAHVMNGDYNQIALAYTDDAKIFPGGSEIIEGRSAIQQYWTPQQGARTVYHEITPGEIQVLGDTAYDYGIYKGRTKRDDGSTSDWKGKYVIVWKKTGGEWKMYLDIWNRIN